MQAKEWTDQDAGKLHRSRLEREKETAMAARSGSTDYFILFTCMTAHYGPAFTRLVQ